MYICCLHGLYGGQGLGDPRPTPAAGGSGAAAPERPHADGAIATPSRLYYAYPFSIHSLYLTRQKMTRLGSYFRNGLSRILQLSDADSTVTKLKERKGKTGKWPNALRRPVSG